ncbi:MAG: hypothetical protein OXC19_21305 [Bryobacterales bacterium]|nr:hypothetical protein [Bryobacterales bacterium]
MSWPPFGGSRILVTPCCTGRTAPLADLPRLPARAALQRPPFPSSAVPPPLLSNAQQQRYLCYIWDGWQIATVYEKRELDNDGLS